MKYPLKEYISDNLGSLLGIGMVVFLMSLIGIRSISNYGYQEASVEIYVPCVLTGIYLILFTIDYFKQKKLFKKENK